MCYNNLREAGNREIEVSKISESPKSLIMVPVMEDASLILEKDMKISCFAVCVYSKLYGKREGKNWLKNKSDSLLKVIHISHLKKKNHIINKQNIQK